MKVNKPTPPVGFLEYFIQVYYITSLTFMLSFKNLSKHQNLWLFLIKDIQYVIGRVRGNCYDIDPTAHPTRTVVL